MIPEMTPAETLDFLKEHPDAKLIDVRTDEEYAVAKIPDALLVNSPEKVAAITALPKDTPLVFQCHHGMRSLQAALWFQRQGFASVFNLSGGIDAWSQTVDSTIPRY